MSYSKLVEYVRLSPNCTKPRNKKIDAIVIHHMAGNATVEECGNMFAEPSRQASSNYGVGTDGRIACYVEDENRAWTSGSREIDNRAITIEVANCSGDPDWKVSDKAMKSLIDLCVDICKRHGFKLNYTGDKSGSLHMHKWYQATGCPGPYLGSKFAYIAEEVNKRLGVSEEPEHWYRIRKSWEDAASQTGAYKDLQKAKNDCPVGYSVFDWNGKAVYTNKPESSTYTLTLPVLKKGDNGETVKALQLLLLANGIKLPKYGADSDFGAETENGVKEYQRKVGLPDDGVAGPDTMGSLMGV